MVQGVVPVFVTVTTPVIVPAAPWDCPAVAEMWLHAGEATPVELVVEALIVEVDDDVDVVARWRVVVVVECFGLGLLLHDATYRPAPATTASAQPGRLTPRSLPAVPSRGTAGTGRPVRRASPLPRRPRRASG